MVEQATNRPSPQNCEKHELIFTSSLVVRYNFWKAKKPYAFSDDHIGSNKHRAQNPQRSTSDILDFSDSYKELTMLDTITSLILNHERKYAMFSQDFRCRASAIVDSL